MAEFSIPPLRIGKVRFTLVGDSHLVCNNFHQEVIEEILATQTGEKATGKKLRKPKDPIRLFSRSVHNYVGDHPPVAGPRPIEEMPVIHGTWEDFKEGKDVIMTGRFGFPAVGIKASAVTAAKDCGIAMTDARRSFHIEMEMCEIFTPAGGPKMRQDWVRPQMNVTDIAFRSCFEDWTIPVEVSFNMDTLNANQIVNLFYRAGYGVGIGAFRPEKDGQWGRYHIGPEIEVINA